MLRFYFLFAAALCGVAVTGCSENIEVPPEIERKSAALTDTLIAAVESNDPDAVREALKRGDDPNSTVDRELPALHVAASNGLVEIGTVLISHKADVNQLSTHTTTNAEGQLEVRKGRTPLHVAVMHNQVDFVNLLLDHNADVNAENGLDMTPMDIATNKGQLLKRMQESQTDPELVTQISSDLTANQSITDLLRGKGALTTEEIEAAKLKAEIQQSPDGGLLGRVNENLEKLKLKSAQDQDSSNPLDDGDEGSVGPDSILLPETEDNRSSVLDELKSQLIGKAAAQ